MLLALARLEARRVVGTDLAHGVLLAAAGAAAHWRLGHVDLHLVANLLLGSVPGALLGSRPAWYAPARALRVLVYGLVLVAGLSIK